MKLDLGEILGEILENGEWMHGGSNGHAILTSKRL